MKGWMIGLLLTVSASVFAMEDVPLPLDHADAAVPLSAPSKTKVEKKFVLLERKPKYKQKVLGKKSRRIHKKITPHPPHGKRPTMKVQVIAIKKTTSHQGLIRHKNKKSLKKR